MPELKEDLTAITVVKTLRSHATMIDEAQKGYLLATSGMELSERAAYSGTAMILRAFGDAIDDFDEVIMYLECYIPKFVQPASPRMQIFWNEIKRLAEEERPYQYLIHDVPKFIKTLRNLARFIELEPTATKKKAGRLPKEKRAQAESKMIELLRQDHNHYAKNVKKLAAESGVSEVTARRFVKNANKSNQSRSRSNSLASIDEIYDTRTDDSDNDN